MSLLRHIPNTLTVLRLLAILPAAWWLLHGDNLSALVVFALAGLTDGLDGLLARRFGWTSRMGSILDPLADKLLIMTFYAILGWLGDLPWWLVGLVLGRDLLIMAGAVSYHFVIGQYNMEPHLMSKANTFFQLVLVVCAMLNQGVYPLPLLLLQGLMAMVTLTTLLSGWFYVALWGRRAVDTFRR